MHRLPLYLEEKSIFWNRDASEIELFAKALNCGNVSETEHFLSILDDEALNFKKEQKVWAKNLFAETYQLLSKPPLKDYDITRVSDNFTKIILRGPPHSDEFLNALKLRGQIFIEHHMIQRALKDFEMCLSVGTKILPYFDLCEINGYLAICSYLIRNSAKANKYYMAYQTFKSELTPAMLLEDKIAKIEKDLEKIKDELMQLQSPPIGLPKKGVYIMPYSKFNSNSEIPLSSAVCYVDDVKNPKDQHEKGVFTFAKIPKGSVVVVEHSTEIGVHTPLVQCEYCFKREIFVYTCLNCRYKTYCSVDCMNSDKLPHAVECLGYQNAMLLILDAVPLFRFFQRVVRELSRQLVFNQKCFQQAQTAGDVWNHLQTALARSMLFQRPPITLISNKPDYKKLSDTQYSTLIATALRLTVFINRNTYLIDTYFPQLNLTTKEKMLLTGCFLMRLQCHILLNTLDFEFNLLLEKNEDEMTAQQQPTMPAATTTTSAEATAVENENFNLNLTTELANAEKNIVCSELPPYRHSNECHSIKRLLSTYKDKIIKVCLVNNSKEFLLFSEAAIVPTTEQNAEMLNSTLATMNERDRFIFMRNFANNFHEHFVDYFLHVMKNNSCVPQVLSTFCTTLCRFRHSCEPNVEITFMDNGFIVGKSIRDIEEWEELVVSYKAHHLRHPREERVKYLQKLRINCNCARCLAPLECEKIHRRSKINCHNCGQEITFKCDACKTYYTKELQRYRKELLLIEKKIKIEKDADKLRCLYLCLYELAKKNFSTFHETRIDVTLQYIQFLAENDSHQEACDMIFELQKQILQAYELEELWFSFYDKMLSIIKTILTKNIDATPQPLALENLKKLCDLGLEIVEGQQAYVRFYEVYDNHCVKIIDDKRRLLLWQNELIFSSAKPTVEQLQKLQNNELNDNDKNDNDATMPTLLEND